MKRRIMLVALSVMGLLVALAAPAQGTDTTGAPTQAQITAAQVHWDTTATSVQAMPITDPAAKAAAIAAIVPDATPAYTVVAPTITCYLPMVGTAYAYSHAGSKILSFTMQVAFCVRKYSSTLGPVYNWHYQIYSIWNSATVTAHLSHHTFAFAGVVGYAYKGLDSEGNWQNWTGSTPTRGADVQRRAHWSYDVGYGPFALHDNVYPYVHMLIGGNGYTTIYTGASG